MTSIVFNLRLHSLLRASALVLGSLVLAIPLSHYPHIQRAPLLIFPLLIAVFGFADTLRCIQRRWSFYHAGVILCIYMDLMTIMLMLFFFLCPYFS
ncbi:MAG TPA: permease [Acidobacteriaceae bacterium]|nr:permease [Acidobacteriaceae bacterium]